MIGGSLSVGIDLANYQLTSSPAAVEAIGDMHFAAEVLAPVAVLGVGLGVGLALLAFEAVRVGLTSRWSAVAITFGAAGAGLLLNTDLAVPNAVVFLLGLGRLAYGWSDPSARRMTTARAAGGLA